MALIQEKAGGAPADIIAYLMGTVVEEYGVGVQEGKITDPGEFQDAYGFSVGWPSNREALGPCGRRRGQGRGAGRPVASRRPAGGRHRATVAAVTAQTSKVVKALAALKSESQAVRQHRPRRH